MSVMAQQFGSGFRRVMIQPWYDGTPEEHRDARLVTWLTLVAAAAISINMMFGIQTIILEAFILVVSAYFISRTRYRWIASLIVVAMLSLPSVVNAINPDPGAVIDAEWGAAKGIWLALPMVLASIFFKRRGLFLFGVGLFAVVAAIPLINPEITHRALSSTMGSVGTLTVLLTVAINHRNLIEQDRQAELLAANEALKESEATLEQRVKDRTAELEVARREAEKSNQVKSQFLAAMSHELRTPLNSIINFTKFVVAGTLGTINDEQMDVLKKVVSSAEHLLNLINDVLDISKIESGAMQLFIEDGVELKPELEQIQATAQSLLGEKPVTAQLILNEDLPAIRGDRQRIRQILLNIVSNACKFTDEGSITLRAFSQNGDVVVAVQDTGPGIAEADHERIFETFLQTEVGLRKGSGTGLGLPISRRLAEAHGGRLWLNSTPGAGATFFIALPVKSEALELTRTQ